MTIYYNYNGVAMPMSANPQTMVYGTSAGDETLYAVAGPSGVSSEGGGHDTMVDNVNGDVTFIAKVPTDRVVVADGLTGVRTIVAFAEYALPKNVQNLYFVGGYDWGIGNNLDNLIVMQGNDFDVMDGGAGNDVLVGGFGQNNFQVAAGNGNDVIYNFNKGYDTVRMPGTSFTSFAQIQAAMTQVGSDVVLHIDSTETLTFRGVNIADFHAQNFLLPLDHSRLGALTFDDEFNSLQLYNPQTGTGHWQTNVGGPANAQFTFQPQGNQEQEVYTSTAFKGTSSSPLGLNPFSVNNGVLSITATPLTVSQSQSAWGQSYSSGMLTTRGVFMQQYGYFEMRAELPQGAGTWPAFWLSQDPYNRGGEADVMEHLGMYPNSAYIRAYDNSSVAAINAWLENPTGFHTYGMMWTAKTTTFYIDNLAVFTTPTPASWDKPAYMLLNLAMGGWGGPVDNSAVPAKFNIDYVHVYGLADNSQISPTVMPTAYPAGNYVAANGVTTITVSGTSSQTVTGNNAGDIFYSSDNANHLRGGTGDDRFYMGSGDTVSGGGGGDQYFFEAIPAVGSHITDFASDDAINLYDVMKAIGYTDWDTVAKGYIKVTDNGAGAAQIWVDPNPHANANDWHLLTSLDGVTSNNVVVNGGFITVTSSASGSGGGSTGGGSTGGSTGGGTTPPTGGTTVSTADATYTAPSGVTTINLTGTSAQTVTGNTAGDTFNSSDHGNHLIGASGADTFNIGRGGDVVTGGGGNDVFAFAQNPWSPYGHITDFGIGSLIDFSGTFARAGYSGSDPVGAGYEKITDDTSGNAQIWLDPNGTSGAANGWWLAVTLDGVSSAKLSVSGMHVVESGSTAGTSGGGATGTSSGGKVSTSQATYTAPDGVTDITLTGSSSQTVIANNGGDTITSNNNANHLVGGAGSDTFYIGRGGDTVTGGAGNDVFVFKENPWSPYGHITDFAAGDRIDITPTLQHAGYSGSDPAGAGYLKITSDASGAAQIWLDPNGSSGAANGWWLATTLDGFASANLHVNGGWITG